MIRAPELFAAVGLVLLGVGCWLLSPAAACCVVGSILLVLGIWGARQWQDS